MRDAVKAITVRQPWAWQIIHQGKNIENRTRNVAGRYRGPLIIHASLTPDQPALAGLPMRAPEWVTAPRIFDYGVALGVVDLVDAHEAQGPFCPHTCRPWGEPLGVWHLVLANPRPLPKPIPCRGSLGLWKPPEDVLEAAAAASPPNEWRAHVAHPVIAKELQAQGATYPNGGADLILKALADAGHTVTGSDL